MNPSFFGPPGAQLLGIHHPPRAGSRGVGVVLCSPAPQETTRTHWAFRKLAEHLAKAGFDVLRFDYRGTCDSEGDLADTTPALWVEDIQRAAKELRDIAGVRKVSAVGFRLGALLLAQASAQGLTLETLVMWEPVVSAQNWMARLALVEAQQRRALAHAPKPVPGELLGFVLPPALEQQWKALDLTLVPRWAAHQTAVVAAAHSAHLDRLRRALERSGQPTSWHLGSDSEEDASQGALLGNEALDQIVSVLGERR